MEEMFPEAMKSIHRDHLGIIQAIKRRDVKMVRKVGKRHFDVDRYVLLSMDDINGKKTYKINRTGIFKESSGSGKVSAILF